MAEIEGEAALFMSLCLIEHMQAKSLITDDEIEEMADGLEITAEKLGPNDAAAARKAALWFRMVITGDPPVGRAH